MLVSIRRKVCLSLGEGSREGRQGGTCCKGSAAAGRGRMLDGCCEQGRSSAQLLSRRPAPPRPALPPCQLDAPLPARRPRAGCAAARRRGLCQRPRRAAGRVGGRGDRHRGEHLEHQVRRQGHDRCQASRRRRAPRPSPPPLPRWPRPGSRCPALPCAVAAPARTGAGLCTGVAPSRSSGKPFHLALRLSWHCSPHAALAWRSTTPTSSALAAAPPVGCSTRRRGPAR